MNQHHHLDCPNHAITLGNGYYMDLFLSPGSIVDITQMENITQPEEIITINDNLSISSINHKDQQTNLNNNEEQPIHDINDTSTIDVKQPIMDWLTSSAPYLPRENNKEMTQTDILQNTIAETQPKASTSTSHSKTNAIVPDSPAALTSPKYYPIYISSIRRGTSKIYLLRRCTKFGNIKRIIKNNPKATKAIIMFIEKEAAENAITSMNGKCFSEKDSMSRGRNMHSQVCYRNLEQTHL